MGYVICSSWPGSGVGEAGEAVVAEAGTGAAKEAVVAVVSGAAGAAGSGAGLRRSTGGSPFVSRRSRSLCPETS